MAPSNSNYFRRRAAEERKASQGAQSPQARDAHLELARLFDEAAEADGLRVVEPGSAAAAALANTHPKVIVEEVKSPQA